ncbi:MAG: hypothetical protein OEV76_11245 [Anaerolineae bacterium]|nr:hypothetical protein [Anaerolineae bacterium]
MTLEQSRRDCWRDISWQSFWFQHDLNELVWLLQMLGRHDVILYEYECLLNSDAENIQAGRPTPAVDDLLNEMVWNAYTWVLAAYELVRTINQRLRVADPNADITSKSKVLKDALARLRVPLAKFEPAQKHGHTDYKFPQGCIVFGRGLCWAVSTDVVMSRMELSDSLVGFLLDLKNYRVA